MRPASWNGQFREIGIFGILAAISGAIFCVIGGRVDRRIGPMPVIVFCCIIPDLHGLPDHLADAYIRVGHDRCARLHLA